MTTPSKSFPTFAAACRYPTGASILDSGSAYGRHWQQPPIAPDTLPVTLEAYVSSHDDSVDITATISLAHWLDAGFTVDDDLTKAFEEFNLADESRDDWFTAGRKFMESRGYYQHARDNVYNSENDLSQVFVWEVWIQKEDESDWVYADDAICAIYTHTGCDVRGGYGKPLFVKSENYSYAMQLDWTASFSIESGTDADGEALTDDECRALDERWQSGYSSCPSSTFSKDVVELIAYDKDKPTDRVTVKLKTGETVVVVACMPYLD
jgi:hypothetical protein